MEQSQARIEKMTKKATREMYLYQAVLFAIILLFIARPLLKVVMELLR